MTKFFLRLRIVATIVACLAVMMFASCNKDKDDDGLSTSTITSITADVEGGSALNDLIDEVRLEARIESYYYVVLETAKFTNGGFEFDLPKDVDLSNLRFGIFVDELDNTAPLEGIKVSNENVNVVWVNMYAYDKDGKQLGYFDYSKHNTYSLLYYSDGDVNITGKHTREDKGSGSMETIIYSCSFKKGWNMAFEVIQRVSGGWDYTVTTKSQSDVKWVFNRW